MPFEVKPFVGPDGQVEAPWTPSSSWGRGSPPNADGTVTVTAANGRRVSAPYTLVQGRYCVPFQKVATGARRHGGLAAGTTATLTVRARLQMVRQDNNALTIYTSYPVYYSVKRIDNPERLYVDLFGLDLATTARQHPHPGVGQCDAHPQRAG